MLSMDTVQAIERLTLSATSTSEKDGAQQLDNALTTIPFPADA